MSDDECCPTCGNDPEGDHVRPPHLVPPGDPALLAAGPIVGAQDPAGVDVRPPVVGRCDALADLGDELGMRVGDGQLPGSVPRRVERPDQLPHAIPSPSLERMFGRRRA